MGLKTALGIGVNKATGRATDIREGFFSKLQYIFIYLSYVMGREEGWNEYMEWVFPDYTYLRLLLIRDLRAAQKWME